MAAHHVLQRMIALILQMDQVFAKMENVFVLQDLAGIIPSDHAQIQIMDGAVPPQLIVSTIRLDFASMGTAFAQPLASIAILRSGVSAEMDSGSHAILSQIVKLQILMHFAMDNANASLDMY